MNLSDGAKWSTAMHSRWTAVQVRAYRCATTAAMLAIVAESLGAGKKWR